MFLTLAPSFLAILLNSGNADPQTGSADALRDKILRGYAEHVAAEYRLTLASAEQLRAAVEAFCWQPTEAGLKRARDTWIAAREIYGRTEVFRFGNGPIDSRRVGVETFINAWPVDEAYIDSNEGTVNLGIVGDPAKYPALDRTILRLHNQRGGETNVCTGWHAIEFVLWGKDQSETGPGARPVTDFVDGKSPHADRRREYLREITAMICEDLSTLVAAWREGEPNYRARFEANPKESVKSMLAGPALLTAFEMSGERMAVAFETRDQEEETSCFSDTTHLDFRANMRGVVAVMRSTARGGLIALVRSASPERAQALEAALDLAVVAVDQIPAPFDRAIQTADGSAEREKIRTAIESLELLGAEVGRSAKALGYNLPTEPKG